MIPIERMRALVRRGLGGLDEQDLPDSDVDELLNMSLWELEGKFPFKEKECLITAEVVPGQSEYGLPNNLDAIISVSLLSTETPHLRHKLIKSGWDDEANRPEGETDESFRGLPTHYIRRNRTLIVRPTPDDHRWIIEVLMWKSVSSLVDDLTASIGLPRNWHELVIEGAVIRGHFYNEDYNIAREANNFQLSKIRSAVSTDTKEDRDNRYAGLRVLREFPEDRNSPRR